MAGNPESSKQMQGRMRVASSSLDIQPVEMKAGSGTKSIPSDSSGRQERQVPIEVE
jgi:hypothetical protein